MNLKKRKQKSFRVSKSVAHELRLVMFIILHNLVRMLFEKLFRNNFFINWFMVRLVSASLGANFVLL